MKQIIDLNTEIEKLVNPDVEYYHQYQNIKFFDMWVNEVEVEKFFLAWRDNIIDKINSIADLESHMKVTLLKVLHQDVLKKYSECQKSDYNSFDALKTFFGYHGHRSIEKPKTESKDFVYTPDSYFNVLLEKFAHINEITNYDFYDENYSPDAHKDKLEDEVLHKLGLLEKNTNEQNMALNELYSFVHLSLCLDWSCRVLKYVAKYLDSCINLINKAENFEADKYSFEEVSDNDPTNLKLEYKVNKLDVVFLYRALFESGVLDVDSKNQKYSDTNLRKYLDNANIYFLNGKGQSVKVKGISKEFSKVKNALPEEYGHQEIALLDLIIKKFTDRREKILESL